MLNITSSSQASLPSIHHVAVPLDTQRILSVLKVILTKVEGVEERLASLEEEMDPTFTVTMVESEDESESEETSDSMESDDSAQSAPF